MGVPPWEMSLHEDAEFIRAREAALRFLAYRPRSEAEVRRRLRDRFPAPLVDGVVQRLKEQRLLDDAAFASQWRRDREQHRPKARGMVRQELWRLGVAPEVTEGALEGFDDAANAYRAGQRLIRRLTGPQSAEFCRRLVEHLRRRGFGYTLSQQTALRLCAELADPLHGDEDPQSEEQQAPEIRARGAEGPEDPAK